MKNVNPNIDVEKLVELVDPSKKGVITFSYLCETLVKHPDFKEYFKGGSADWFIFILSKDSIICNILLKYTKIMITFSKRLDNIYFLLYFILYYIVHNNK